MRHVLWVLLLAASLFGQQPAADPLLQLADVVVRPPVADGLVVRVLDGKQAPRRGALVAVVDPTRQRTQEENAALQAGIGKWIADPARQAAVISRYSCNFYQTDADGRVGVARVAGGPTVVQVFAGEAHEFGIADANASTLQLTVHDPRHLLVTVVDAAGKPVAGVPVGIPPFAVGACAITDRDGRARILARPGATMPPPLRVALAVPLAEPVEAVLAADAAEVTLKAPPLAAVRVIAYSSKEQPADDVESVFLRSADGRVHYPPTTRDPSGGTFRVGLGLSVDVVARRRLIDGELTTRVDAPGNAGGLVVADLRQTVGPPLVVFRITDTTPVRDGEVVGIAFVQPKAIDQLTARAQADGTVRVALPVEFQHGAFRVLVARVCADGSRRGAAFEVEADLVAGVHEAGKVALAAAPVLCSGTVVDAADRPVAKAKVWPMFQRGEGMHRSTSGSGEFFQPTITTGADGTFTLASVLPVTMGLLVGGRRGDSPDPLPQARTEVQPGQTAVRVVLP